MDVVFLIGRILFAVPFVLSGFTNHFSRQGVEYARGYGAPAPELMVPLSGVAMEEDGQAQQTQMAQFVKNVSMAGGALVIFYVYNQLQGVAGLSITDPLFGRAD